MGDHYSECYEADEREAAKRLEKELNADLEKFIREGSTGDKKFIIGIISDIKAYKGFFKILHKKK